MIKNIENMINYIKEKLQYNVVRDNKKKRNHWFTNEDKMLIQKRDALYKLTKKYNNIPYIKEIYKEFRNKIKRDFKRKKERKIIDNLQKHQKDIKKTWQIMNNYIGKKEKKNPTRHKPEFRTKN
ncbi:hypothetical protein HET73_07495 [Wolbachia endosymbiont of Atemnus politus]|uniref:hypothetical protein n=1 Tax=Wolbachia endosymbiont of Atemnus politus TaxID=2682840 RepID=UPI0015749980|nr:hypothetical protein [Wolbachia endosymbiont of Atemnus politus]NSM57090.1 hypothetical protein [Wolbachia endosymbiont of Atemnus politus]